MLVRYCTGFLLQIATENELQVAQSRLLMSDPLNSLSIIFLKETETRGPMKTIFNHFYNQVHLLILFGQIYIYN